MRAARSLRRKEDCSASNADGEAAACLEYRLFFAFRLRSVPVPRLTANTLQCPDPFDPVFLIVSLLRTHDYFFVKYGFFQKYANI